MGRSEEGYLQIIFDTYSCAAHVVIKSERGFDQFLREITKHHEGNPEFDKVQQMTAMGPKFLSDINQSRFHYKSLFVMSYRALSGGIVLPQSAYVQGSALRHTSVQLKLNPFGHL